MKLTTFYPNKYQVTNFGFGRRKLYV